MLIIIYCIHVMLLMSSDLFIWIVLSHFVLFEWDRSSAFRPGIPPPLLHAPLRHPRRHSFTVILSFHVPRDFRFLPRLETKPAV